jgi:hypothetical protein
VRCRCLASCVACGLLQFDQEVLAVVAGRDSASAYVGIRQHTSAYGPAYALQWDAQTAYDSIRQHASHTSAYEPAYALQWDAQCRHRPRRCGKKNYISQALVSS